MVATPGTTGAPGVGVPVRRSRSSLREASSPTQLRVAMAVTVLLALVMGLGGWWSVQHRSSAIDDAASAARRLIRIQDVRVFVVEADSIASRTYLAGGEEDPDQRQLYEQRVAGASSGMIDVAASASAGDAALLQDASAKLGTYVGLIEQARANNRQGYPVGAAYLRQARTVSAAVVEDLRRVEDDARDRVDEAIARAHRSSWALVLTAVLLLAAIAVGGFWLATRWKRLINIPLAIAGIVTLAVVTVGVGVSAAAMTDADDTVEQALAPADVVAQARAAAFDARADEALTLVYRGNGAAFAQAWEGSRAVVDAALASACDDYDVACGASDDFGDYVGGYRAVRDLDDGGDWDAAVALSTGASGAPGGSPDPVTAFDRFATSTEGTVDERSDAAAQGFDDATSALDVLGALVVLAAVAAAIAAVAGYGQRLREYR